MPFVNKEKVRKVYAKLNQPLKISRDVRSMLIMLCVFGAIFFLGVGTRRFEPVFSFDLPYAISFALGAFICNTLAALLVVYAYRLVLSGED